MMSAPFAPPLSETELQRALPRMTVRRSLGAGGQGAAFLCVSAGREVVVKVYGAATEIARVEREIEKLGIIDSPHVLSLLEHGTISLRGESCRFSATSYIEGCELGAVGRLLDERETRRLLLDVGRGIAELWSHGVVHRDIKPANVLRAADGRFVIIDLGVAKYQDQGTLTAMGWTLGTMGYMSPEQAAARKGLTFRSDLFSLGVVAYQVSSGCHPFLGQQGLVGRIVPKPLGQLVPMTEKTSGLIMRLLSTDSLRRAVRLDAFLNELGEEQSCI